MSANKSSIKKLGKLYQFKFCYACLFMPGKECDSKTRTGEIRSHQQSFNPKAGEMGGDIIINMNVMQKFYNQQPRRRCVIYKEYESGWFHIVLFN